MTTAASSCITYAEERIRDMLAGCSTFQTWTGSADAAAAKSHIYYDAVPRPLDSDGSMLEYNQSVRPFALVWTDVTNGYTFNEMYLGSGTINVRLEQDTPTTTLSDYEEADRLFKNTVGDIIASGDASNPGLIELSRARSYTQITEVRLMALYRTTEDEYDTYGNAQAAELAISWGTLR